MFGKERPGTVCDVDKMVSAEIPYLLLNPFAYQSVCQFMIHRPCGVANPNCLCMVAGACSKHYTKEYSMKLLLTKMVPSI